ncbi:uncharacterized protein EI90DRAFT_88039 [Cantharellus anzutake]|uniref:uncharacterized protein n=1 Tax=Cantharellus anzutake TaxID=1750568 RepID=UPI001907A5E9|nr:uncharacterized protein EI90DRAFT_88039 [Cantharellus anzutake]KAF8336931.1 hypothetical protein EI90DRAFT_88039 [Cantharellus anzutake]
MAALKYQGTSVPSSPPCCPTLWHHEAPIQVLGADGVNNTIDMPVPNASEGARRPRPIVGEQSKNPRSYSKRGCDRDWAVDGGKCSVCDRLQVSCDYPLSEPPSNGAGTPFQCSSSVNLLVTPSEDAGILDGVEFAESHFPGIFDRDRFTERSMRPMEAKRDGHEHFSPMLHWVFCLLRKSLGPYEFRELLQKAKRAFGEEFEDPSLATIMATILLSEMLSKLEEPYWQFGEDLLDNAYAWLHSYHKRDLLKNVPSNNIRQLMEKAKEAGFGLRDHCTYEAAQPQLPPSSTHEYARLMIPQAPAQSVDATNMNATPVEPLEGYLLPGSTLDNFNSLTATQEPAIEPWKLNLSDWRSFALYNRP